jgi:hypothetical protein
MTKNAWTPGPWEYDGGRDSAPWLHTYVSSDGKHVFHGSRSEDEQEANARLIAACPDFADHAASLIEAWDARTTGAQQIITGKSDRDLQKQAMAAIDGLRAALAKARGA